MSGPITSQAEINAIDTWLASEADSFFQYVKPNMITDAEQSNAIRFRWYGVDIGVKSYLLGVNIHYGGAFGSIWFKDEVADRVREYHPHMAPTHNLAQHTLKAIRDHVKAKSDATHQYYYTKIKNSYFGEFQAVGRPGSEVFHGRNSNKILYRP